MLIVVGTACLCLLILVLGTVIGVMQGAISADILGEVGGAGVGGGLLGFGIILYRIIRVTLSEGPRHG